MKKKNKNIKEEVEIIAMPRLSDTMKEGTIASWLKNVGDKVKEGDILAEIETDKATMEFECFYEGTILYIGVQEGETAPVDSLLIIIGPEDTNISNIVDNLDIYNPLKDTPENDSFIFGEKFSPDDFIFYEDEEINETTNLSHTLEWLDSYIKDITKKKYVKGKKIEKMIAKITNDLEIKLPNFNYESDKEPDDLPF
jgi:pyruvate/2-oxoglutarate dehydrogenase complex dihydrolipoamide acyltransferase (E2) component